MSLLYDCIERSLIGLIEIVAMYEQMITNGNSSCNLFVSDILYGMLILIPSCHYQNNCLR